MARVSPETQDIGILLFFAGGILFWMAVLVAWRVTSRRTMTGVEKVICAGGTLACLWGLNLILVHYLYFFGTVGGIAWAGKIEGGRYYVGPEYVEVSRSTYWASWWHTLLTFASLPVVMWVIRRWMSATPFEPPDGGRPP